MNSIESIAKRRASMPPQYRKVYDEAMTGDSRKAAIRAKCFGCMGYEDSPANCTSPDCELFPYRPAARPRLGTPANPGTP